MHSQERLDLTVDSGAAVSAIPRDAAKEFPTVQDKEPKNYTSASGHAVPTLGSKRTVLRFQNGKRELSSSTLWMYPSLSYQFRKYCRKDTG